MLFGAEKYNQRLLGSTERPRGKGILPAIDLFGPWGDYKATVHNGRLFVGRGVPFPQSSGLRQQKEIQFCRVITAKFPHYLGEGFIATNFLV